MGKAFSYICRVWCFFLNGRTAVCRSGRLYIRRSSIGDRGRGGIGLRNMENGNRKSKSYCTRKFLSNKGKIIDYFFGIPTYELMNPTAVLIYENPWRSVSEKLKVKI